MTYVRNPVAVSPSPLAMDGKPACCLKPFKPIAPSIRFLVVDDDRTIPKSAARMLGTLAIQAAEIAQRQPEVMEKRITGPYAVLITELEMPDMNGWPEGGAT